MSESKNKSGIYLDKCKEKLGISSSYALHKRWGISEKNISRYYLGESNPDEFACFKIAETLEIDAAYVIADIRGDCEKNLSKAEYFRSFVGALKKATESTVLVLVLSFSCVIGGEKADDGKFAFF